MRGWVGVTDWDWYQFLLGRSATEVNFWQPSGAGFGAIQPGAPFLFKTKAGAPRPNRIVGGGFFSHWVSLPMRSAWDIFGEQNGCASFAEMRTQIEKYRSRQPGNDPGRDIGCIMLRDVQFFGPGRDHPAPPDWKNSIVQGKSYDLASPHGSYVEQVIAALFGINLGQAISPVNMDGLDVPGFVPGEVFGDPRLSPVRLGQNAFKALVQEAYGRRCAITGDKIVPVLQAAHIRPVTDQGENRIDNGLLLRSDVHTLFDRGYLGVDPAKKTLMVSRRLRAEWGNGEEFYRRAASGEPIAMPARVADRPNAEFLTWHADTLFMAS
jgi:putative restriction endonuclease